MPRAVGIFIGILVLGGAGLGGYWYYGEKAADRPQLAVQPIESISREIATAVAQDLGTDIFLKSSNPLAEKLPDTIAPVNNPIEDLYRNPFD